MDPQPARKVHVAVTHWNRVPLLRECLQKVLGDPRIESITVSDDCSNKDSWNQLEAWAREACGRTPVSLFRNDINQDCYKNKCLSVRRTLLGYSRWVIVFDSDNILTPTYLDALFALPEWDTNTVYMPEFAEPHFNFTHLARKTFDKTNVSQFLNDTRFVTMLNAMNYFVHAEEYLRVWDGTVNPHTADSIYQNYRWLGHGNKLYVVPGCRYFHRVHEASHYKMNQHKTKNFHKEVINRLKGLK